MNFKRMTSLALAAALILAAGGCSGASSGQAGGQGGARDSGLAGPGGDGSPAANQAI